MILVKTVNCVILGLIVEQEKNKNFLQYSEEVQQTRLKEKVHNNHRPTDSTIKIHKYCP